MNFQNCDHDIDFKKLNIVGENEIVGLKEVVSRGFDIASYKHTNYSSVPTRGTSVDRNFSTECMVVMVIAISLQHGIE